MNFAGLSAELATALAGAGIANRASSSRLPDLPMKKYGGNIIDYSPWWSSFETAVDKNSRLSTIEKFNYLLLYVEGPAAVSLDAGQRRKL